MTIAINVQDLYKQYQNGFKALDGINLQVKKGEIFALLGPNGAGKTTLISIICGIVNPSAGKVSVLGYDNIKDYRTARSHIGLVPQELTTDAFEKVINTVKFSRGLFNKPANDAYIEEILTNLSLWDKRDSQTRTLSGGMKRRLMIAKALSHEPDILFLDEPTAGVDVELRRSMWQQVHKLRERGTTILLTTHYIEEAEEMADRIGVIRKGQLVVTEDKKTLLKKLGKKQLCLELYNPIEKLPESLKDLNIEIVAGGIQLIFTYDPALEDNGVVAMLDRLRAAGIHCKDFNTKQSSLEDIFVDLLETAA